MKDIAIVLGIRPDVIRASKILKLLNNQNQIEFDFICQDVFLFLIFPSIFVCEIFQ